MNEKINPKEIILSPYGETFNSNIIQPESGFVGFVAEDEFSYEDKINTLNNEINNDDELINVAFNTWVKKTRSDEDFSKKELERIKKWVTQDDNEAKEYMNSSRFIKDEKITDMILHNYMEEKRRKNKSWYEIFRESFQSHLNAAKRNNMNEKMQFVQDTINLSGLKGKEFKKFRDWQIYNPFGWTATKGKDNQSWVEAIFEKNEDYTESYIDNVIRDKGKEGRAAITAFVDSLSLNQLKELKDRLGTGNFSRFMMSAVATMIDGNSMKLFIKDWNEEFGAIGSNIGPSLAHQFQKKYYENLDFYNKEQNIHNIDINKFGAWIDVKKGDKVIDRAFTGVIFSPFNLNAMSNRKKELERVTSKNLELQNFLNHNK